MDACGRSQIGSAHFTIHRRSAPTTRHEDEKRKRLFKSNQIGTKVQFPANPPRHAESPRPSPGNTIEFDREMMHAFRPCPSLSGNLIVYIAFFHDCCAKTRPRLTVRNGRDKTSERERERNIYQWRRGSSNNTSWGSLGRVRPSSGLTAGVREYIIFTYWRFNPTKQEKKRRKKIDKVMFYGYDRADGAASVFHTVNTSNSFYFRGKKEKKIWIFSFRSHSLVLLRWG